MDGEYDEQQKTGVTGGELTDIIKHFNGKGKVVLSISVATLISLVTTVWWISGKYNGAETNIKKVPTIEQRVGNLEKDMTEVKTTLSFVREDTSEIKGLLRRRQ